MIRRPAPSPWGFPSSRSGAPVPQISGFLPRGVAPTPAPWSPLDLPNLELWFDSKDLSTIHQTSGSLISWDDKSGNNRHATVNMGSVIVSGGQLIGEAAGASLASPAPFTNGGAIFAVADTPAGFRNFVLRGTTGYSATPYAVFGTTIQHNVVVALAGGELQNTTSTIGLHILESAWRSGESTLRIDGDSNITFNSVGTATTHAFSNLGTLYDGWNGSIEEIIVASSGIDDSMMTACRQYLSSKYSIPVV